MFSQFASSIASTLSNNINANRNYKTPLLVFVHGFLGSQESFRQFPSDIQEALLQTNKRYDIKSFEFPTTGDNDARVNELVAWLLENASVERHSHVVLLSHSMGGLMSADAAAFLLADRVAKGDGSGGNPNAHAEVNIRGILAFDSPFFGLHSSVFLETGAQRIGKVVETASTFVSAFSRVVGGGGGGAVGSTESMAASSTARTATLASTRSSSASLAATTSKGTTTTAAASSSSSSSFWGTALLGAAALATAAAVTVSHPTVQDHISRGTEAVNKHLEFLGPLWKVEGQEFRLQQMVRLKDALLFKCFFLSTKTKNSPQAKYFINTPPEQYSSFFEVINVDATNPTSTVAKIALDEIEAHMHMFDRGMGMSYGDLLVKTAAAIEKIGRNWR
ncbi:hypothetical protein HDU76_001104 [Blyttiomyces sp. JEL0837]|nr:hypothetical protein HDU76_001104 [Blyttiomyces sp. JEL0837]